MVRKSGNTIVVHVMINDQYQIREPFSPTVMYLFNDKTVQAAIPMLIQAVFNSIPIMLLSKCQSVHLKTKY